MTSYISFGRLAAPGKALARLFLRVYFLFRADRRSRLVLITIGAPDKCYTGTTQARQKEQFFEVMVVDYE